MGDHLKIRRSLFSSPFSTAGHRGISRGIPPGLPATGNTDQTSGLKPTIKKTRNTNSVATQKHFSLRLWNSIEKEQGSRGRNKIQFSRATFNRLCHETVVILLQLSASFTMHLLILTNKQSGSPIGKSLLYSTLLIHLLNMLHLCALNEAGMLCKEHI